MATNNNALIGCKARPNMITTDGIGNAIRHFVEAVDHSADKQSTKHWTAVRNNYLRSLGVGGIVKDGKKSKTLPGWWDSGTEFWFETLEQESVFVLKFGK